MAKNSKLVLIAIAYSAFVVLGLFDGLLGVAWPGMRGTFGLPVDALGVLLPLGTGGYILASALNDRLITRYGLAVLLFASAGLTAAGRGLQAAAPAWWLVLLAAPLAGLGIGLLDAGMNTFASARFRPRLLNWLHASFGIGTTLGALVMTGILTLGLTWRSGLGLIAGLNGVLLLAFILTRRRWQLEESVDPAAGVAYARNRETLRKPIVWASVLLFFLYTGLEIGLGHWAYTLLTESRGVAETTAGLWTTFYWGSFTAGRLLLGFIETNLVRLVRLALAGAALGILAIALNLGPGLTLFGLLLAGSAQAPVFPALIAETPGRVGRGHAPNAIGFQIGAAGLGVAILPGLAGWLGDGFGLEMIVWFLLGCAVLEFLLHELVARRTRVAVAPSTAD